jgi:hypothetical protein
MLGRFREVGGEACFGITVLLPALLSRFGGQNGRAGESRSQEKPPHPRSNQSTRTPITACGFVLNTFEL